MGIDYSSFVEHARKRLEALKAQRKAIDAEISALEQGIATFQPLTRTPPYSVADAYLQPASTLGWLRPEAWTIPEPGLTDAIRSVLAASPARPMAPTEIRDALVARGFDFGDRTNPMANIHQVLSRLTGKGVKEVVTLDGKKLYQWVGEQPGHFEKRVMEKRYRRPYGEDKEK